MESKICAALEPFAEIGRHPHPVLALISGEVPGLTDEQFRRAAEAYAALSAPAPPDEAATTDARAALLAHVAKLAATIPALLDAALAEARADQKQLDAETGYRAIYVDACSGDRYWSIRQVFARDVKAAIERGEETK